jgi:outer membrane protein TolC
VKTAAVVTGFVLAVLVVPCTSLAKSSPDVPANATDAVFTLPECIERALERNPRVLAAEDMVKRAGSETGVARADFLPQASVYTSRDTIKNVWSGGIADDNYEDQTQTTIQLQVSQTLFAGLTIINNYQRSLLNEEYVKAQKAQEAMGLVLEVQTTFFDRLKGLEDVARLQASVERLELNARVVRAFLDKEMIPYSNVLEVEAELADSRQQLSQAENFVAQKTTELKTLIQVPDEMHIDFLGKLEDRVIASLPRLDDCLSQAQAHRPEITVGEKGLAMAQKDREIAKGRFYPRVSASFSYNERDLDYDEMASSAYGTSYDQDRHNNYYKGQLTLQWDLFQGGRKAYEVQRMRHEISRVENNLRQTRDQVATQVRKSYLALKEARGRIRLTQSFLESARENYDRAISRLHHMVGTILEVLVVEERLRDAEASHVKALADFRVALAELNYAVGRRYGSQMM